jgi:hypothetical protein
MIRKLMTVVSVAVVAAFTHEAHAQAVKLEATAPAAPPPPAATVVVAAPGAASAAPAAEEHYRLPVSYTERGITNPEKILSPEADLVVTNVAPGGGAGSKGIVNLALQAGYSITDDLGVRATVVPLELNSPFAYLGPSVGATYRFLKGDFELGVAADLTVQTCSDTGCFNPLTGVGFGVGVAFVPSVPMRFHFGKKAILDLQPGIPIVDLTKTTTTVGLNVPVRFAYDIIEPLHVGAMTGFGFNFNAPAPATVGDSFFIPFGIFGGYAIAAKEGPMLDIDPFFLWPQLFTPATQAGANKANGAFIEVGVNVIYYLYL